MSYKLEQRLLNNGNWNGNIVARSYAGGEQQQQLQQEGEKQQPVRLQPSWEESNLPEDELNFKNLTMDDASLQLNTPKDRLNLVYLTFLLHGIGILMPWNMFITAKAYFTEFKLGKEYVGEELIYASSFLQYLGFASQVPNVIFSWMNIFLRIGGDLTTRIVWSISIEVILFVMTVVLAMSDSRSWPGTFFWLTMLSVVIINMANGIYQNTIYGMAAKLPSKYTTAVVVGNNLSGTFTAIILLLSDTFASSQRMSAIYYFITALFVLLVCFDTYFALPLNRYYRHFEMKHKKLSQQDGSSDDRKGTIKVPYFYVFKKVLPQLWNVFFVFFCTLSIFPAVHANIKVSDVNFFISDTYYTTVTCFLTFNLLALFGSSMANFVQWPKPKYLWLPVALRVLYLPFYILCNYQEKGVSRILPIVFNNDWAYWGVAVTFGFTSGYFSALGLMYTPRYVESKYASTAGMFGAAALTTGIFAGILSAFIWPWLIGNVGF